MADYDWFTPSDEELRRRHEHDVWMQSRGITTVRVSTAVETEFYACLNCGAVLMNSKAYVEKHVWVCPVESKERVEGKHKK